jgi:hypothetical protein
MLLKTDIRERSTMMAHKSNIVFVQYIDLLEKVYIDENSIIP